MTPTRSSRSGPVRRGGLATLEGFRFELSGGRLALDFINTLDERPSEHARELLPAVDALVEWAGQAGLLTPEHRQALRHAATQNPTAARKALGRARSARETLFALMREVTRSGRPAPADLLALNGLVAQAAAWRRLHATRGGFTWTWHDEAWTSFDFPLWAVAWDAAELLTSDEVSNIRVCAAEACDWLFMDRSKNHGRRWCDMKVCGNREKARRFRNASR